MKKTGNCLAQGSALQLILDYVNQIFLFLGFSAPGTGKSRGSVGYRGDTLQIKSNSGSSHPLQQTRMKYSLVLGFSYAEYFPFVPLPPPSHLSLLVRLHLQQFQISSQHLLHPLALLFIA